ncbi:YtxH domain-containing protein [Fibrella aquatilis]|uniref:YtxH domain-containing protein n=1 Tax=Fibrella aquatilis TaxID=2817059 RepID=A0A939GDT7_9BACT|nr:YtxH domain-containing protein [Fibrella aquatilis]MBO0934727.1 YtxH domain-containing protein [Fibrella aquatilis]
MAVNAKHLATFILGAAAGVALNKYMQTEEGEKMMADLKEKGTQLKTEAEGAIDNAPEYFEKLKAQLAEMLKTNFPNAEQAIDDVLGKKPDNLEPKV